MSFGRWEAPCRNAEEACQVAQGNCIREKGDYCEAYSGVDCKSCLKYKEGIQRRKKRFTNEEKGIIGQVILRDNVWKDNKIVRLREGKPYFYLEIGKIYDSPPLFIAERCITIDEEEIASMKQLLAMKKT